VIQALIEESGTDVYNVVKETLEVLPLFPMPSPKRHPKDHNNNKRVVTF
jgi:hypothetical protein